jgi:hypothetical protein
MHEARSSSTSKEMTSVLKYFTQDMRIDFAFDCKHDECNCPWGTG